MKMEDVSSKPAFIRGINVYSFRRYEWAELIGVRIVTPGDHEPRPCYMVLYEDGFIDYLPITDHECYEIDGNIK